VPGFSTQYAAPLGSARRYGLNEPDLPIEVGEEERRLHNDARRFARLLVSEIKELVNTLAEGDPAKLGASYPGAVVAVN